MKEKHMFIVTRY